MSLNHTNALVAFLNLIKHTNIIVEDASNSTNRANQMGESLEKYVKNLFCDSFGLDDAQRKIEINKHFSYDGNQNNPPDIMLRDGDAIEVKKIESLTTDLALNSSHPKDALYHDDTRISEACRNAETWTKKDILYVIGSIEKKTTILRSLWMVYGNCYSADKTTYENLSDKISKHIISLEDVEFAETNELARVNNVDPLGITYLRVRGMWHIENPRKVYDYLRETKDKFANLLMLREKYNSFPEQDRKKLEETVRNNNALSVSDVRICDPNNPAKLLDAKLISYKLV